MRRKGARAGQRVDRRGSYASVGPGWKIQEVSRVGAQGDTSKSKLLAQGGMFSSREYEETYIVANALVHPFPVTPPAHARAARRGHHHHAVVLLRQHKKEKREGW